MIQKDRPYVIMEATFQFITNHTSTYSKKLGKNESINIGSFNFLIGEKNIQFDFDASAYVVSKELRSDKQTLIIVKYSSGKGLFYNEFYTSDCYDEEWLKQDIIPHQITAKYLSKVTKILAFHFSYSNEQEIHYSIQNFIIKEIKFMNENQVVYSVLQNVLSDFQLEKEEN